MTLAPRVVYDEWDPFAGAWLAELVRTGELPQGVVLSEDVRTLNGVAVGDATFHAFAGIGGWPLALRWAGWPNDVPVWTGSCPCQPFSQAGRGKAERDDRHLWPAWLRLIRECAPPVIFGEQVASPLALRWLDAVLADLEGLGYAVGTSDLPAASVSAPHKRQRIFFVAVAHRPGLERFGVLLRARSARSSVPQARRSGEARSVADAERGGSGARRAGEENGGPAVEPDRHRAARLVGDSRLARSGRDARGLHGSEGRGESARVLARNGADVSGSSVEARDVASSGRDPFRLWDAAEWLPHTDGFLRPVEPGSFPLSHGVPGRVGRLRGYGNAIVPQLAATFVTAAMGAIADLWLSGSAADAAAEE